MRQRQPTRADPSRWHFPCQLERIALQIASALDATSWSWTKHNRTSRKPIKTKKTGGTSARSATPNW